MTSCIYCKVIFVHPAPLAPIVTSLVGILWSPDGGLSLLTYGRPFFVCSDKTNPCSYWVWGDVRPITKPECRHGSPCVIRKIKKEGLNKDRRFFCCPNDKENSCRFFEWIPEEPTYAHYRSVNFFKPPLEKPSLEKPTEHYLTTEFINDFAYNLAI